MPQRSVLQALSVEQRERDEATRVARQRILLRVSAEIALVEITHLEKGKGKQEEDDSAGTPGQQWLYQVLRDLLASDREHTNVPLLLTLLKALGGTLLPPARNEQNENGTVASAEERLVGPEMQARFQRLCETYNSTLTKRMLKEYTKLQEQDKKNYEAYIRSGEIFEDRQHNYEKMTRNFEKLHEWAKALSELLNVPVPELSVEAKATNAGIAVKLDNRPSGNDQLDAEYASGKSMWEDEDTRRFYEDLVDLMEMVPASLLNQKKEGEGADSSTTERNAEDHEPVQNEQEKQKKSLENSPTNSPSVELGTNDKDNEEPVLHAGPTAQLNAFLAKLPDMSNKAMIDTAAVDFAFLNSKAARRRLIKDMAAVPRHRSDLLPYYARLIATLNKYMPDIGQGILAHLDDEFRYLQKKRNVDLSETRTKNMRFIGELVKFRVTPLITTFHCFKVCLDDFSRTNIESLAVLLETCGRYLLRNDETHERMKSVLEMIRRKRAAQNLDQSQLVLLDNAYYQCNPPEREAVEAKKRTPIELYIHYLIYDQMNRQSVDVVLKKLRKLPWNDGLVRETLYNAFVRSWRIKFGHLHLLGVILHDLQKGHPDFVVHIIDTICEQVRAGMESNLYRDNQRRVATLKYLGELYNYRLINTNLIFEQLWSLVTFGHPNGQPLIGQVSPIDAPDDYFRIRLVCTLLDTCGQCFDRGALRKKLDDYLLFFNLYVQTKLQPLPMDIEFMLQDTLDLLRPKLEFKQTFEEAALAVDQMFAAQQAKVQANDDTKERDADEDLQNDTSESSDEDADSASEASVSAPHHDSDHDSGSGENDENSDDEMGSEEEQDLERAARRREHEAAKQEEEDEFSRELAKMMAETGASQTAAPGGRNQRGLFDVGLPFVKRTGQSLGQSEHIRMNQSKTEQSEDTPPQHMRFSLLSKRGNKQHTQEVQVPIDAALAVHSRANEQQQLAERQQLKKLVLGIETREQANDRSSLEGGFARRGFRGKQ